MAKQINNSVRARRDGNKCEKIDEKLSCSRRYSILKCAYQVKAL